MRKHTCIHTHTLTASTPFQQEPVLHEVNQARHSLPPPDLLWRAAWELSPLCGPPCIPAVLPCSSLSFSALSQQGMSSFSATGPEPVLYTCWAGSQTADTNGSWGPCLARLRNQPGALHDSGPWCLLLRAPSWAPHSTKGLEVLPRLPSILFTIIWPGSQEAVLSKFWQTVLGLCLRSLLLIIPWEIHRYHSCCLFLLLLLLCLLGAPSPASDFVGSLCPGLIDVLCY